MADNGRRYCETPHDFIKMTDYANKQEFVSGVTITIILDLSKAALTFEKDNISLGVCYNKIARDDSLQYKIEKAGKHFKIHLYCSIFRWYLPSSSGET